MRLTIVNQFYVPDISPTAHLVAGLAGHRAAQGDTVTIVASHGGYASGQGVVRHTDRGNPDVRRVWTPRLGRASLLRRLADYATFYLGALAKLLLLPRQDVIISLTTPPYVVVAALAHKLVHWRTRVVLWNMDCYPEAAERAGTLTAGGIAAWLMRAANRFIFRSIDHLVCLDRPMAELLMTYGERGGPPVTVIPNWEPQSLYPCPGDHLPAGLPNWYPRDRFVVLYLGNAGSGHEFETVMDVADALRAEPVVFLFVGGGSRYEWLDAQRSARGLSNVELRGYVPKEETPTLLAASGCGLITLRRDALGVMSPSKLHAQLAMGLPVLYVGPEGSNVDEAVAGYGCGSSFRNGDKGGVLGFVRWLARDETGRRELGARARRAFEACYSDERCLPRFDAILKDLTAVR